jgi:predicted SAM-dependent methyltransferase
MNKDLAVIIVAENNEDTIEKCISSVKECSDQIKVVDIECVDNTINKIKDIKEVEVVEYTSKKSYPDISEAINLGIASSTKKIIMWLFADEYILPLDIEKINCLPAEEENVIICSVCYNIDNHGEPDYIFPEVRIKIKYPSLRLINAMEPRLAYAEKALFSNINIVKIFEEKDVLSKIITLRKIVRENKKDSFHLFVLGDYYQRINRFDKAKEYLNEYLNNKDGSWNREYRTQYMLASIAMSENNPIFEKHFFKAFRLNSESADLCCLIGSYWENKKVYRKAIQWYTMATSIVYSKEAMFPYYPRCYTWLPCLQLCLCYNHVNDIQSAYDWNTKALSYRPNDSRMLQNKKVFEEHFRYGNSKEKKAGKGKKLNLGCGNKALEGYVNVDIFRGPIVNEIFEFDNIPYMDGTISAISSEHALEHVGWKRADRALKEWHRVLSSGGELNLKIPDFEECCRKYLENPVENEKRRLWFKYTIYGIQQSQAGEPDEVQYHRFGWSMSEMTNKLKSLGFKIKSSRRYDGFDTPSMEIVAIKL